MGQKVNPHGLRVGVIKDWDSRWYARPDKVGDLIVEDDKIRKYLKKRLYAAGVPTIEIERDSAKVRSYIHCSRPGVVIGKGGATIRGICEETKASIDIEDDGSVKIYGETKEAAEAAKLRVLAITAEAEIGKIYVGKVERIVDFGAFVNILPGKDGLVHISQISDKRIDKVTDVLQEGQEVKVLVLDVDNRGRIKLSIKDVAAAEASGV